MGNRNLVNHYWTTSFWIVNEAFNKAFENSHYYAKFFGYLSKQKNILAHLLQLLDHWPIRYVSTGMAVHCR